MGDKASAEGVVKAALYASFFLSARTPGLTLDELVTILTSLGFQRGEASDAVTQVKDLRDAEFVDGRLCLNDSALELHLGFVHGFTPDPRNPKAFAFVQKWILAMAKEKSIRQTRFGRTEVLTPALDAGFLERDVDCALEVLVRKRFLAREDGDMFAAQDPLRTYTIIGEQIDDRPQPWAAMSLVLPLVEKAIESRSPAAKAGSLMASLASLKLRRPTHVHTEEVLLWIVRRFADTLKPVLLEDVELAFAASVGARAIAHRLAEAEFLRTVNASAAVPTVLGVALEPSWFAEPLMLLDTALANAARLRRQKASSASLFGATGLIDVNGVSESVRETVELLAPTLRPMVAYTASSRAELNDLVRDHDSLVKFLEFKAASSNTRPSAEPTTTKAGHVSTDDEIQSLAILFLDVAGWSKLGTESIRRFVSVSLPKIEEKLAKAKMKNSWGDAVVATFGTETEAANSALEIRDFFVRATDDQLPSGLQVRIGLHRGQVLYLNNPVRRERDIFGNAVHVAARLEPVTPAGAVYCTREFAQALLDVAGTGPKAHAMGKIEFPKGFGTYEVFAVTWNNEKPPAPEVDNEYRLTPNP